MKHLIIFVILMRFVVLGEILPYGDGDFMVMQANNNVWVVNHEPVQPAGTFAEFEFVFVRVDDNLWSLRTINYLGCYDKGCYDD